MPIAIPCFEDVLRLGDEAMSTLLREVENAELGEALRGAPAGIVAKFNRCMSLRAAMMIREYTLLPSTCALPESRIAERRRSIVDRVNRLLAAGAIRLENPDGPIHPNRIEQPGPMEALPAHFADMLEWNAGKIRAEIGTIRNHAEWATALHGLPETTVKAFLEKFPWQEVVRLRQAIVELTPPRPEDVELARLTLAHRHQPPTPFTVETAKRILGDAAVREALEPASLRALVDSHRATVREAMGEAWLEALEKELPSAPGGWLEKVKRFFGQL